jgi:hypothetical protein
MMSDNFAYWETIIEVEKAGYKKLAEEAHSLMMHNCEYHTFFVNFVCKSHHKHFFMHEEEDKKNHVFIKEESDHVRFRMTGGSHIFKSLCGSWAEYLNVDVSAIYTAYWLLETRSQDLNKNYVELKTCCYDPCFLQYRYAIGDTLSHVLAIIDVNNYGPDEIFALALVIAKK